MSSPPGTPGQMAQITLTAREIELLACGMQSTKDANIQIDYDKFAALAGLTIGSARVLWGKLRRKIEGASSGRGGTPASAKPQASKSKPKNGPTKRKISDLEDADADADDTNESQESPTKGVTKRRAKKAKKAKKVKDDVEVKEEGENAHVKDEDAH